MNKDVNMEIIQLMNMKNTKMKPNKVKKKVSTEADIGTVISQDEEERMLISLHDSTRWEGTQEEYAHRVALAGHATILQLFGVEIMRAKFPEDGRPYLEFKETAWFSGLGDRCMTGNWPDEGLEKLDRKNQVCAAIAQCLFVHGGEIAVEAVFGHQGYLYGESCDWVGECLGRFDLRRSDSFQFDLQETLEEIAEEMIHRNWHAVENNLRTLLNCSPVAERKNNPYLWYKDFELPLGEEFFRAYWNGMISDLVESLVGPKLHAFGEVKL